MTTVGGAAAGRAAMAFKNLWSALFRKPNAEIRPISILGLSGQSVCALFLINVFAVCRRDFLECMDRRSLSTWAPNPRARSSLNLASHPVHFAITQWSAQSEDVGLAAPTNGAPCCLSTSSVSAANGLETIAKADPAVPCC